MQNYKIDGIGKINGGEFNSLNIQGVCNCSNNIKAEDMHIEGVFTCEGQIDAKFLYCEGVANIRSDIRSKRLTVEGVLNLRSNSRIEAEEINCEGVIKTRGEISADFIKAEGCIEANEIVGDQIIINSHAHGGHIVNFFNRFKSKVGLIEATTIELKYVKADTVNGRDITIGPNCLIDNIDCTGTLSIDSSSSVRNITGNYTMK